MYSHDVSPLISPAPGSDHRLPLAGRRRAAVVEWVGEIIAMVVSIVALVVVAGIAWTMNDRPLAEWPLTKSATPISINAVISAITVLSRATLAVPIVACVSQLKWLHFRTPRMVSDMDVFDSASRGGLGSLQFLFKIPKNGAALGALATVLAYAMGPFYQQAIRLEQRDIEVAGNQTAAAFGFSHEYVTGVKQAPGGGYLDCKCTLRLGQNCHCLFLTGGSADCRHPNAGSHDCRPFWIRDSFKLQLLVRLQLARSFHYARIPSRV